MREEVLGMGLIETEPSKKKRNIRVGDDNVRRTQEIDSALEQLLNKHSPAAVCAEEFIYHRNIKSTAKVGLAWGTLISQVRRAAVPLLTIGPQDLKVAVAGDKKATKEDVETALLARYGTSISSFLDEVPLGSREHPFDALGAIVASLEDNIIRMTRKNSGVVVGFDMGFASLGWAVVRLLP
jgi:Holliday junction resolvasome RuvABC endonuclease subunit